jgi:hypothetical protein
MEKKKLTISKSVQFNKNIVNRSHTKEDLAKKNIYKFFFFFQRIFIQKINLHACFIVRFLNLRNKKKNPFQWLLIKQIKVLINS